MTSLTSRRDDEDITAGGPIGALVIAVPMSLVLWGSVMLLLFHFIR